MTGSHLDQQSMTHFSFSSLRWWIVLFSVFNLNHPSSNLDSHWLQWQAEPRGTIFFFHVPEQNYLSDLKDLLVTLALIVYYSKQGFTSLGPPQISAGQNHEEGCISMYMWLPQRTISSWGHYNKKTMHPHPSMWPAHCNSFCAKVNTIGQPSLFSMDRGRVLGQSVH